MTAPKLTLGSHGNVVASGTSIAAGKLGAVFFDAGAYFEAQVTISFTTGGAIAATLGGKFEFYCVYDAGTTITNGGGIAAGATSVTVASASGITQGQKIYLDGNTAGTGEIVTVSNVSSNILTINATVYAHAQNNAVKLIEQSPSHVYTPAGYAGAAYATTTVYSKTQFLGPAQWVIQCTNLDNTNAITFEITQSNVTVQ